MEILSEKPLQNRIESVRVVCFAVLIIMFHMHLGNNEQELKRLLQFLPRQCIIIVEVVIRSQGTDRFSLKWRINAQYISGP